MTARSLSTDRDLAEYIIEYVDTWGFPPSRRQIAAHLGVSANTAQTRLERLVKEGIIDRSPGVPRGIKVNRQRLHEFGGK